MVKIVNFMLCLFYYNLKINIFKYKRNLLIKIYVAILLQRENNLFSKERITLLRKASELSASELP